MSLLILAALLPQRDIVANARKNKSCLGFDDVHVTMNPQDILVWLELRRRLFWVLFNQPENQIFCLDIC